MSKIIPLTPQQRAYILAHLNDRPRTAVARAAGCSVTSVYRLVRAHSGTMLYERAKRNPEWERIVREYYPTMAGHEIERRFGITPNRANIIARELGIRHTPETEARLQSETKERLRQARKNIDHEKRARRWKARRRLDQYRVWDGKPQQTAFRFSTMTKRANKCKHYLISTYGYIAVEDEPYTLLYDHTTRRRPLDGCKWGTERYYTEKYKLTFKELKTDDTEEQHDQPQEYLHMEQNDRKKCEVIFDEAGFANIDFDGQCAAQLYIDSEGRIYITAAMNGGGYPINIDKINTNYGK